MTDFLLELLSEEIPARMQAKACEDLARLFAAEIGKAGLAASAIETYATPRRLALIARALPGATAAVSEEIKGPRADAPPQALAGFLGKTGLTRDQLVERTDAKGNAILFAVIERPGRPTPAVLADAVQAVVRGFPWPKSMRWGDASAETSALRWVRPLRGIVALFGEEIVPFAIDGIESGAATVGHRFRHPGIITIGSAEDYAEKLRMCHVILDPAERQAIVREGAAAAAAREGLTIVPDEGLVAENAGLTEWPVPLLGRFDPAFLDVPREVIQLTMRTNQKYFACTDADGALAPAFVCTANIDAADGGAAIVAGNAKVLAARLSDARFFWEQDLKVPLAEQAAKLDRIVFHEKLGTVADKAERIAKLARWLVEEGIVGGKALSPVGRRLGEGCAAQPGVLPQAPDSPHPDGERETLADLVTGMVGEFPELQGIVGGYIAARQGLDPAVAESIRDHYKPVGQGDEVPTAPVTVAVSLADKLDSFFAFFGINEAPTGSRDPFALRRQTLAIISIALYNHLALPLWRIVDAIAVIFKEQQIAAISEDLGDLYEFWSSYELEDRPKVLSEVDYLDQRLWGVINDFLKDLPESSDDTENRLDQERRLGAVARDYAAAHFIPVSESVETLRKSVTSFATDRLKVQQREAGVRHDLIDAVFALGGEDDLVRLLARVHALQAFVATGDGASLLAGYKRAANILRIEEKRDVAAFAPTLGFEHAPAPEEADLLAALAAAEPAASDAVAREDFAAAMTALAALRPPIDAFFERVTVNDPDPATRAARLGLLVRIRDAVHRVADFSRIEG